MVTVHMTIGLVEDLGKYVTYRSFTAVQVLCFYDIKLNHTEPL